MTPLSAKTGGKRNVEGEETKKYERDEGKGDGEDERDERRSSGVIVRRKGEEGRERERKMTGRRSWDETSRPRRGFIHPRCSDCSPKTIYGLPVGHRPSASLPRCTWLTIGENGRRHEGRKKNARKYSCRVCSNS